jgi:sugar (pentulose or hexulose) kinase
VDEVDKMSTAVLDVGKTNLKFVVFDDAGTLLFERQMQNTSLSELPYPHVDVDRIWKFLGTSLREAALKHIIETLIATTHGASCVVMNEQGLVLPIMDYEFTACEDINPRYEKLRDPFNKTYSPSMPAGLNIGRQLAWQKWNMSDEFARVTKIVGYPQYWTWRLCGKFAFDICSMGAHTDLWLSGENKPSKLAEALGFDKLIAPITSPWAEMGMMSAEAASELGVKPNIKILCGIHDSNAALLPYLASRKPPFTVLSTGTWVVVMAVGQRLSCLKPDMDMLGNIDAEGRPTATAKFMGGREFAAIAGDCKAPESKKDIQQFINSKIFALPSFSPNGGPYAALKGKIIGDIKPEQRTSIATLYAALMCTLTLDNLEIEHGDLIVDGSFAQNHLLCEIIAALRPNQNLYVAKDQAGTARGAAMLATWHQQHEAPEASLVHASDLVGLKTYYKDWKAMIT